MDAKLIWLFLFVGLYWAYCLFWGIKGAVRSKTSADYFLAGRSIGIWVFVLAATATSFSGWTFIGHPGKIFTDGLPYAFASFYALTIPFTGVLFLRRQWVLGRAFNYITPGEMYSDYYGGQAMRLLTVLVAFLFSVPYLGVQLKASGAMFHVLTDGMVDVTVGMFALSAVVMIYVAAGGLRSVAYVDCAQCILLALGIVILGVIAICFCGGWSGFTEGIAQLVERDLAAAGTVGADSAAASQPGKMITPDGHSRNVAMPGVIQMVKGVDDAQGGPWTGMLCVTYMFALMGIQSSPAFSMWAYANKTCRSFRWQQVVASSLVIGVILFTFTIFQGLGGHILERQDTFPAKFSVGAEHEGSLRESALHADLSDAFKTHGVTLKDGAFVKTVGEAGVYRVYEPRDQKDPVLRFVMKRRDGELAVFDKINDKNLVPKLINLLSDTAPWLVGLLAVCALAAMQSTGAAYMSTFSGMVTRDLYKRYVAPDASDRLQKMWGRIFVVLVTLAALVIAATSEDAIVMLGGLAVAYGFQMYPALMGICYFPWLSRRGIVAGLIAGLIAVTLTDSAGAVFGVRWGRFPLTIHSAGWGILFNLVVAVAVSALLPDSPDGQHKKRQRHAFLQAVSGIEPRRRKWVTVAWVLTVVWFVAGFGPFAVVGNTLFSDPNVPATWAPFGLPSIWIWQLLMLVFGIFVMWLLAFQVGLSNPIPPEDVERIRGEHFDVE